MGDATPHPAAAGAAGDPSSFLQAFQTRQRIARRNDEELHRALGDLEKAVRERELELLEEQRETRDVGARLARVCEGARTAVGDKVGLFTNGIDMHLAVARQARARVELITNEAEALQGEAGEWMDDTARLEAGARRRVVEQVRAVERVQAMAQHVEGLERERDRLQQAVTQREAAVKERCLALEAETLALDKEREMLAGEIIAGLATDKATAERLLHDRRTAWEASLAALQKQRGDAEMDVSLAAGEVEVARQARTLCEKELHGDQDAEREAQVSAQVAKSAVDVAFGALQEWQHHNHAVEVKEQMFQDRVAEQEARFAEEFQVRMATATHVLEDEIKRLRGEVGKLEKEVVLC